MKCIEVTKGNVTLSCLFKNCQDGEEWFFTSVYYRGTKEEKELFWRELGDIRRKGGQNGIAGGDFNMVIYREERNGGNFCNVEVDESKDGIDCLGLMDLPLFRGQWT